MPGRLVLPSVGDKVWIEVIEGDKLVSYTSRVEDVNSRGIVLAAPMYKGALVRLHTGKVQVRFIHKDAMYVFEAPIIEQRPAPIPVVIVGIPKEVKREQRREYVRVPWLIPAKFLPLTESEFSVKPKDYPKIWEERLFDVFDGVIKDISGGGIRFNISKKWVDAYGIKVGSRLIVTFHIEFELLGNKYARDLMEKIEIVREVPVNSKLNAEYGAKFVDIPERDRDFIIRAVLQRQRELIKKGVL